MSLLKTLLLLAVILYFGLGTALYLFQRSFIYFPTTPLLVSTLSDVSLEHQSLRLNGHVANAGSNQLILYFGGNAEQIAYSLQELAAQLDHSTVTGFHYRGYSGSEGEPSEQALYADALYIYDQLAREYDRIVVMGRSLGSGVATHIASERKVDKLILVTPFDSIVAVAARLYWFYPVKWMMTERYDSYSRAKKINAQTLVLIAQEDTVIPRAHSERLLEAFQPGIAQAVTITNAGHNTIAEHPSYLQTIEQFLNN